MKTSKTGQGVGTVLLLAASLCWAQPAPLDNPSFEEGQRSPAHWTLEATKGTWEAEGHTGRRSVSVIGNGQDSGTWKSDSFPLAPDEIYRITFWTRTDPDAQSGCITSGTRFVNRDFDAGPEWEKKTFIFKNPVDVAGGFVKFGQWKKKGRVWFDDVEIHRVIPRHYRRGDVTLGADETVFDGTYRFRTRLSSEQSNYARPLVEHTAGFNSDRWCFGDDQYVVYRFEVGAYPQTSGRITFNINYYTQGECIVEASTNEKTWTELGRFKTLGKHTVIVPPSMLPATAVWVKFTGKGNFQINSIAYEARLSNSPPDMSGFTWWIEPMGVVKDLDVNVITLGDLAPGGKNEAVCAVRNSGFWGKTLFISLEAGRDGEPPVTSLRRVSVPGFKTLTVTMGYGASGVGLHRVALKVTEEKTNKILVTATQVNTIAAIHDAGFGRLLPGPAELCLWWTEATYKVGRTRPAPTSMDKCIRIWAARNEYEPFQLVLHPTRDLENVGVRVSDLKMAAAPARPGPSTIKSDQVRIETVEYVQVEVPTDAFGCPGEWPDPLVPYEKPITLRANRNQPIWFTVHVPEDAAPGEYSGEIEITYPGASAVKVPLTLFVWPFTLPKETHTKTAYGVHVPSSFLGLKKDEDRARVHDLYMRNCAEHRIAPYSPMAVAPWKYTLSGPTENPTVTYDFTAFDQAAHRYLDEFGFNTFNFGGIPAKIGEHKRFTPEFKALFKKIYGPIAAHLKEKGWLSKAYCYWFDEPEPKDYPTVIEGMKLLQEACPGLQRLLTEQPEPELYDVVDIWVPVLSNYNPLRCRERQRAGQQVWWYVCCGPRAPYPNNFIDHPAINHRIRFWMMQKYGVTGSLYWSATYYHGVKGTLRNPWTSAMSISPTGGMWGNGDGMLLYPPVREPSTVPVIKGPFNSIRWELLREGLEDREYFWLLEQAIAKARKKSETAMPDERSALDQMVREAENALQFPEAFIADLTRYTKDPQDLYAARARIAQHIERLTSAVP